METTNKNEERLKTIKYNFDDFYKYCKMYYEINGDLDIGAKCMIINVDGVETIFKRPTPEELDHKVYDLGAKMILVREALETGTGRSPSSRLNGVSITPEQASKLDEVDAYWRVKGQSSFMKMYRYCVEYKKVYGELSIAHQCVAVKRPNEDYFFEDKRKVSEQDRQYIEYTLGPHFWKYVDLAKEEGMANKKRTITPEQYQMLADLDPYWAYPRNKFGERIDPITNQKLDVVSANNGMMDKTTKIRRNKGFDFDEFYGFALLYHAKYGELNIGPDVVVVRLSDGRVDFYDRTLATREKLEICYQLGRRMKLVRSSYLLKDGNAKLTETQKIHLLNNEQYQSLTELDSRWLTNTVVSHSQTQLYMTRKKRYPKKEVIREREKEECEQIEEDDPLKAYEKKIARLFEVKNFNFDTFYTVCKHQADIVGSLVLSKLQRVVFTNADGIKEEYPLGPVWYVLATTKLFELKNPMYGETREPMTKIHLTDAQNQQMETIDKLWFLPSSKRREIRRANQLPKEGVKTHQ